MIKEEAIQIQLEDARRDNLITLEGGGVLVTSDFFFKDESFEYVARGIRGGWIFFDEKVAQKRDKLHKRSFSGKGMDNQEEILQKHLAKELEKEGYKVKRELTVTFGRIDLFVDTDPPKIIEIKLNPNMHNVSEAIKQLTKYSYDYPNAELYFYSPEIPDPIMADLLARRGIFVWR